MSVLKFDPQIKTINWMIKMISENPGSLFNCNSNIYNKFWQSYVDLSNVELPNEMDFPCMDEYIIKKPDIDYSDWYKNEYNKFCIEIQRVKEILIDYINNN